MDHLSSQKRPKALKTIGDAGAQLLFPPPCSPDFNPVELAFAKLHHAFESDHAATSIRSRRTQ